MSVGQQAFVGVGAYALFAFTVVAGFDAAASIVLALMVGRDSAIRAYQQAKARGEALRSDDDPEILKRRLEAYWSQTVPLIDYYRLRNVLKTVDGMEPIQTVANAVEGACR